MFEERHGGRVCDDKFRIVADCEYPPSSLSIDGLDIQRNLILMPDGGCKDHPRRRW